MTASRAVVIATSVVLGVSLCNTAVADPTRAIEFVPVQLSVTGSIVVPGAKIPWSLFVGPYHGVDQGLAGISVDLVPDPFNPAPVILSPGTVIPSTMAGFARPGGISNPSTPDGPGYFGTPKAIGNQTALIEIGGVQNTFGTTLGTFGLDTNVDLNIAKGVSAQLVTSGSFRAPSLPGVYSLLLQQPTVTLVDTVRPAPQFSSCVAAQVALGPMVSFSVRCTADIDDGSNTGTPDGGVTIEDLTYYIDLFAAGDPAADVDDDANEPPLPDGGVTIEDLLYFLTRFEAGC